MSQVFDENKPYVIVCEGKDDYKFLDSYLHFLSDAGLIDCNKYQIMKTDGVDEMPRVMHNTIPKVFISYAWEDDIKIWVKDFTDRLISDDIDAYIDQYDLTLGDRLPQFMEQQITSADYVLIICTPTYKRKANKRIGGVEYEGHIISAELLNSSNERKFIPVIRKGTFTSSMPDFLLGKVGIDLSENNSQYELQYKKLLDTINGQNPKPRPKSKKIPLRARILRQRKTKSLSIF